MKKILSLIVSLGILAIIYWKLNQRGQLAAMGNIFASCDRLWMAISLGMVVPITLFTAWRLQQLMPGNSSSSSSSSSSSKRREDEEEDEDEKRTFTFAEANRLILVASVLNLVLPSKMGDIAKAWFIKDRGHLDGSLALSLVVFEKACDMLSLLLWCGFGLIWVKIAGGAAAEVLSPPLHAFRSGPLPEPSYAHLPGFWIALAVVGGSLIFGMLLLGSEKFAGFFFDRAARWLPKKIGGKLAKLGLSWGEMHAYFWASKARLARVTLVSVFIWFLHLLQIWMFILALRAYAPFLANLALSPLAILAGLLPLTFAGVGTRDAALVLFYSPHFFPASTAAALGLLCTARYLLPAIGGLPFIGRYLPTVRAMKKSDLADPTAQPKCGVES